jgi:hypothetical protein
MEPFVFMYSCCCKTVYLGNLPAENENEGITQKQASLFDYGFKTRNKTIEK